MLLGLRLLWNLLTKKKRVHDFKRLNAQEFVVCFFLSRLSWQSAKLVDAPVKLVIFQTVCSPLFVSEIKI